MLEERLDGQPNETYPQYTNNVAGKYIAWPMGTEIDARQPDRGHEEYRQNRYPPAMAAIALADKQNSTERKDCHGHCMPTRKAETALVVNDRGYSCGRP